jgi:catechol 2,3-dioxygenase-like lactoylglutathione lyase family enzyme
LRGSNARQGLILGAMPIKLNHTIVHSLDPRAAAEFFAAIFGRPPPVPFGPFLGVQTPNEVTLDFFETDEEVDVQHFAFLVDEQEFDAIFARVKARGLDYWADPGRTRHGEINRLFGGRGVYFEDPCGHLLEIITRPYGSD